MQENPFTQNCPSITFGGTINWLGETLLQKSTMSIQVEQNDSTYSFFYMKYTWSQIIPGFEESKWRSV